MAAGYRQFYFVDNTFNFPLQYAKDLCTALDAAALKIRWHANVYPGFVDEELVRTMAKAGCVEVSLGFESGSPAVLSKLNKQYAPPQVRVAAHLFQAYGIRRMGFLLLGGPGETRETVRASLDFADSLQLDMLKLTMGIQRPLPSAIFSFDHTLNLTNSTCITLNLHPPQPISPSTSSRAIHLAFFNCFIYAPVIIKACKWYFKKQMTVRTA